MTIVKLPRSTYIPPLPTNVSGAPTINTSQFEINSATDDTAFLFTAPLSGTITQVGFRTATVTTGCTLDVRLETVSAASGDHSGTLFGTNTNVSQVVANGDDNTWFACTLTAGASTTIGDDLALVLDVSSGTPSGLQIATIQDWGAEFPASIENDGTPAALGYMPIMAVYYSGIGWVECSGTLPISAITTTPFNNTSTPDIRGNRISFNFDTEVSGFWVWADSDGDFYVRIYGSDGVTVLVEKLIPSTYVRSTTAGALYQMYFNKKITLTANTNYYFVVEPSSASSMSVYSYSIPSTDYLPASFAGSNWAQATAKTPTGTGDWTITTTEQVVMGLLVEGFENGQSTPFNNYQRGATTGSAF